MNSSKSCQGVPDVLKDSPFIRRRQLAELMAQGRPTWLEPPTAEAAGSPAAWPARRHAAASAAPLGLSMSHIRSLVSPDIGSGYWEEVIARRRKQERRDQKRQVASMLRQHGEDVERGGACIWSVEWYKGGGLVQMKRKGVHRGAVGGMRGAVKGFSGQSRFRLMCYLQSLDQQTCGLPIFITLTYPGEWPGDPERWKRDLKVWLDRLRRKHPEAWGVWKLEPQKRGAPHYHLLIFGVEYLANEWVALSWYEVVGSGDARHYAAGTRVEAIRTWNGAMSYASKYCGKVIEDLPEEWRQGVGRWWGVFNRPAAARHRQRQRAYLHWKAWFALRRVVKRYGERKSGRRIRVSSGTALTGPIASMDRLIRWADRLLRPFTAVAAVDFIGDGEAPF